MSGLFLYVTQDYGMVYRSYTTSEPLKKRNLLSKGSRRLLQIWKNSFR